MIDFLAGVDPQALIIGVALLGALLALPLLGRGCGGSRA